MMTTIYLTEQLPDQELDIIVTNEVFPINLINHCNIRLKRNDEDTIVVFINGNWVRDIPIK